MASYFEAAKESFEAAIFKAASQLDLLASLRDHKNMLLSELLNEKGVFLLQQVLANLCVFLNFAKGMICNYYKSFVVVVSPLTSLMKDRDV